MKLQMTLIIATLSATTVAMAQAPSSNKQTSPPPQAPASNTSPAQAKPPSPATTATPAQTSKIDPAEEKAIRRLIELNGTSQYGQVITESISYQVKTAMSRNLQPDRLQKFMDAFNQKLTAAAPTEGINNAIVPIYAEHFSMEDIQGMIKFYESPLGTKMVKNMPPLTQQVQTASQDVGRKAALSILAEMSGEYPELKPMLPSDNSKPEGSPQTAPSDSDAPHLPHPQPPQP
jgi:hypothetical protein